MTIGFALYGDSTTDYPLSSTLTGDTTTEYPMCSTLHYSVCRYNKRLSALLRDSDGSDSEQERQTVCSTLSSDTTTYYLLCASLLPLFSFCLSVSRFRLNGGSGKGFLRNAATLFRLSSFSLSVSFDGSLSS
jgi:hypothetical protein